MSTDKPMTPPVAVKLDEISPSDRKIAEIEAKLALPTAAEKEQIKQAADKIVTEKQSIDDYLSAMLGIKKK